MSKVTNSILGKLFNYFQQRLDLKKSTKGFYRTDCIWCGGKFSMGINVAAHKIHCFKCEEKKRPIEALMDIENFETLQQAYAFLKVQEEYEFYEGHTREKVDYKPIELPEGYNLITHGKCIFARGARHYLTKRGFNIKRLAHKGVGYCTRGDYAGYIIFPFYRKGRLIYFQGRIYMGNGPKMRNPPEEEYGVGKAQLIYNPDALFLYDTAYWVESITNAETIGYAAAAGLGKSVSSYQMGNILFSPCSKIVILLDPDAYENALKMAMQIVHYKKVKVVLLPEGKDVNDLGKKKTLDFVKGTKYQDYNALLKLKINLNGKRPEPSYKTVGPYKNIGRSR